MTFENDKYEKIVELAKRRGFFWPSYEVYGGVAGFYDLGPLGALLKQRIIEKWRNWFIKKHQQLVVEIETPIITPSKVLEASGHIEHFTDPIVECLRCGRKFRADQVLEEQARVKADGLGVDEIGKLLRHHGVKCPVCGGELGDVRLFNLLFTTTIGPYAQDVGFLRPETAQGIFVAFKRVYEAFREKLPIGIAQIGRVTRNEISPRQGMVRLREFTIMEVEFFFDPEEPDCNLLSRCKGKLRILPANSRLNGEENPTEFTVDELVSEGIVKTPWLAYWMCVARDFILDLGVPANDTYFEEKLPHERAHYSLQTFDQLVKISRWGWIEVSGHAYRGDYDLSRHMRYSGQDFTVFKRFKEPVVMRVEKIFIDKATLGRMFKDRTDDVLKYITSMSISKLKELLGSSDDVIRVGEFTVPKSVISIREITEKVSGRRFIPHVVEPSFGAERILLVVLDYAYHEEGDRIVLKIPKDLAPIQVAVFPLVEDEGIVSKAKSIYESLVSSGFYVIYDESGSIGRRYARADEIGVPVAITVDYQSLEDNTVTLRDRDTRKQVRVHERDLIKSINDFLGCTTTFNF